MSIDKQVFVELLGELQAYYKREFTSFVQRTWYKHLNDRLSTEEFVTAVEQAVVRCQFMPTPEQLVELIRGDSEGQALVAWDRCLKAAASSDRSILKELSPQAKFALTAVGGLSGLGRVETDQLNWQKKEFISAWKSWIPSLQNALPPADNAPMFFEKGVDPGAVGYMRSLVEKMSANPRPRQDEKKQDLAATTKTGSTSAIADELREVVEEAIKGGASRSELSFAISDGIACGGSSDEMQNIIRSSEPALAALAIRNFYEENKDDSKHNGWEVGDGEKIPVTPND